MATKNCDLSLRNDKTFGNVNSFSNQGTQQYSNLNLNANQKYSSIDHSNSETTDSKSTKNYKASIKALDQIVDKNDFSTTNNSFWSKTDKSLYGNDLNLLESQENDTKNQRWKNDVTSSSSSKKSSSTLSLHIAAYENSVIQCEGREFEQDKSVESSKPKTSNFAKTWKGVKEAFSTSSSMNAFEIPRQQEEATITNPEVMQFKSSQRLLNPNNGSIANSGAARNGSNRAIQIIEHLSEGQFKVDEEAIREIYGNERVANIPLISLCIAGASRKGKSFLMNFFRDFLSHKENNPNKPWQLNENSCLAGFEFRGGKNPTTLGIWAWDHIFVIERDDGSKVAVSLIDSQGTFDEVTSTKDSSTIFGMTCMFSSVMCFNVENDLQENVLNDLAAFVNHAKMIVENLDGTGKLFQDLAFIFRDFPYKEYLAEDNGGQKYLEEVLSPAEVKENQEVRDIVNSSFERKYGFTFPRPGEKVEDGNTLNIAEMNPYFVKPVKRMIETLFSHAKVKQLGPTKLYCKDMCNYIPKIVKCCHDNQGLAPDAVYAVNRDYMINLHVKRLIEEYSDEMDKVFADFKVGCKDETLAGIHNKIITQLQDVILKRFKNQDVNKAMLKGLTDETQKLFQRYKKKNELLFENEKKFLKETRVHEEDVKNERAVAAQKLQNQENVFKRDKAETDQRHQSEIDEMRLQHQRDLQDLQVNKMGFFEHIGAAFDSLFD